ncbi:hypothetical protein Sfulv_53980 [Streptomyces fulvorobeus]|uniref:Uncharacterized protein n=1 Tax=Streptomyces fulvorobeus TaxID=284028 RepID=A0A7J0CEB4_9ACTN|nr:hypothetical protein Sfulv_53980 [Streptomyces fulvorobeus]
MEQVAALGAFGDVQQADDEAGARGPEQGVHVGHVEGGCQARDDEEQGGEGGDPGSAEEFAGEDDGEWCFRRQGPCTRGCGPP